MEVLNERVVWQFAEANAFSESPLQFWVDQTKAAKWTNSNDVLATFKNADHLGNQKWIFDIGGNKFRLAAMVWIQQQRVFVLKVMTHEEYNKENF